MSGRRRRFVTHLVDLDTGTVLVSVPGRSAKTLVAALEAQGEAWRAGVSEVAIDMFVRYAAAVRAMLPRLVWWSTGGT